MQKTRIAIGAAMLGMASMANAVPDPRQGQEIRTEVRQTKRQKDLQRLGRLWGVQSKEDAERESWNNKVDAAKRGKNAAFGRRKTRSLKKRTHLAPSNVGCTVIQNLIHNYQAHSNSLMHGFTGQRAIEYKRRIVGRSIDGIKAEAEHLHRVRGKHSKRVSHMIGGNATGVVLSLCNIQQGSFDAKRTRDWSMWEPVAEGIWQYHVHDEILPYFMFNDEAGDMFEFDPAKLHFSSIEDCNRALHLYANWLNSGADQRLGTQEKIDARDAAALELKQFCETVGHTLQDVSQEDLQKAMQTAPSVDADCADDETYALRN